MRTNEIFAESKEGDNCQIELQIGDINIDSEAENYFYALVELRKKLEMQSIKLLYIGCSRHVYPSPMILDMGDAGKAYELTLGKQALTNDLIDIFTACEYDEYVSVKEQYEYYEKWLESRRKNDMKKIVCFHNPDEINGYLSNWYLSDFEIGGIRYSSMEQYMMYQKAVLFHDDEIAQQILETSDVGKIKALGRSVKNYDDIVWNGLRQIIVYQGLLEKFRQNDELKKKLLATQQDILAECAVQDSIWGIGLSMKDDNRFDMEKWRGQNLLGFSLMYVRSVLEREE